MSRRAAAVIGCLLVPLVCFVSAADVHAGRGVWTTAGPEGGVIQSLAVEPGISSSGVVYIGTVSSGVFKSSTAGNFWTSIGLELHGTIVALVVDPRTPTTLYAATIIGRVFKSTDGGASWGTGAIFQHDFTIWTLTIDPQTPTTLYAGTFAGAGSVLKSTDGGATWRSSSGGLPDIIINALAVDPRPSGRSTVGRSKAGCSRALTGASLGPKPAPVSRIK